MPRREAPRVASVMMVDDGDLALRNHTYRLFVELGRAPTIGEVAHATGMPSSDVGDGWRRLHDAHALVLDPAGALRMLNPFSVVPTSYRVETAGGAWHANCAWDAFGVCSALHADGTIIASCPDCGDGIALEVVDGRPDDHDLLFHCLVPAAHWWDDIAFT